MNKKIAFRLMIVALAWTVVSVVNPRHSFIGGAYGNEWNRNGFERLRRWDNEYARVRGESIKTAIRLAESRLKGVRFGSRAWWLIKDEIKALERERDGLRRYSTYRDLKERNRIQGDYYRTHRNVLETQAKRANMWMEQVRFGSREWWAIRDEKYALRNEKGKLYGLYTPWQVNTIHQLYRQQREIDTLRKRTIEKQIAAEELRLRTVKFGSPEWWAIKDYIRNIRKEKMALKRSN